jgi:hypothetical protein
MSDQDQQETTYNEVVAALTGALDLLDKYAKEFVVTYGRTMPELINIVASNKSGWGGGAGCTNNLIEAAIRRAAISLMTTECKIKK